MARNKIIVENARIIFKNFSGKEGQFNPAGRRNFCWLIDDPELVKVMERDGWNVRYLTPRDEGEDPQPYVQVAVNFGNVPPKIVLITEASKTVLDESTVDILDYADIANIDMTINPYPWTVQGRSGVKAYLDTLYVTIVEDELEKKYRDVPDSAKNAPGDELPF